MPMIRPACLAMVAAGIAGAAACTPAPDRGESGDSLPYHVVSPARDSVWREGETHMIRWTAARPGRVNIGAVAGGKDKGHLAMDIPAAAESLAWRIPEGFISGFGPSRSDAVRIRVEDAADPRIGVESDSFAVTDGS